MRLFRHELRYELRLYSRSRELAFFTFLLPLILFLMLGFAYGDDELNGVKGSDYLLIGTLGYGVVATAFAGLTIVIVLRREDGILKRLRSTPLPAPTYLTALLTTTMIAFLIQAVVIVAVGMSAFGASFPSHLFSFVLSLILGAAAFAALGVGLTGLVKRAEGASAVVNAIYFPMLFLSGSFFERDTFPEFLQVVADALPLTYFFDLVFGVVYGGDQIWDRPQDVAALAIWGLVGAFVAVRKFHWTPTEG
ncbi:MAG TPA: ABC transporter permease [Gaiellaceae bacterium]|nr:ABC transporter permease [Gaiellaceae bacterium]